MKITIDITLKVEFNRVAAELAADEILTAIREVMDDDIAEIEYEIKGDE